MFGNSIGVLSINWTKEKLAIEQSIFGPDHELLIKPKNEKVEKNDLLHEEKSSSKSSSPKRKIYGELDRTFWNDCFLALMMSTGR